VAWGVFRCMEYGVTCSGLRSSDYTGVPRQQIPLKANRRHRSLVLAL
jgi:hypothetical protein